MKTLKIDFYSTEEEPKPNILDEVIYVGVDKYDVVTYDGEFIPAWVEWWGRLDLTPLD